MQATSPAEGQNKTPRTNAALQSKDNYSAEK